MEKLSNFYYWGYDEENRKYHWVLCEEPERLEAFKEIGVAVRETY